MCWRCLVTCRWSGFAAGHCARTGCCAQAGTSGSGSAGSGAKGRRTYDWAVRQVTVKDQAPAEGYAHHLLIRRSKQLRERKGEPAMHEIGFFLVHAPRTPRSRR